MLNRIPIIRRLRNVPSFAAHKINRIFQKNKPVEREFRRVWPHINEVDGLLVSPIQEQWLFRAARLLPQGSTIVEIGSFKGRSTCALAYGCRRTNKHVFAIDTFKGNDMDFKQGEVLYGGRVFNNSYFDIFLHNIENNGLARYVTPIIGMSSEIAKTWNKPIQLLFIDGSHEYEDVLADFHNFYPHVVPGGIVAFHDVVTPVDGQSVSHPGVFKVWHNIASPLLTDTGHRSTLAFGRKPLRS